MPSPRIAVKSCSKILTSIPFLSSATARTSPAMPPPATTTLGGRSGSKNAASSALLGAVDLNAASSFERSSSTEDGADDAPQRTVRKPALPAHRRGLAGRTAAEGAAPRSTDRRGGRIAKERRVSWRCGAQLPRVACCVAELRGCVRGSVAAAQSCAGVRARPPRVRIASEDERSFARRAISGEGPLACQAIPELGVLYLGRFGYDAGPLHHPF